VKLQGLGVRVQGLGVRVWALWFRVQGLGIMVKDLGEKPSTSARVPNGSFSQSFRYIDMYKCIQYMYMYICIYIYIYMYMYVYIYIDIYSCLPASKGAGRPARRSRTHSRS
jgi:hypothetical protein